MALAIDHGAVHIGDLFATYMPAPEVKKPLSERAELVRYFFENASREWQGAKALTPARIGMKLAHLSVFDLYAFKSQCEDRRHRGYPWGKYFWGSLKIRA